MHIGILGVVINIQKDDIQNIYSVILENGILSEFIVSSIKEIILVCDECAKKYQTQNKDPH